MLVLPKAKNNIKTTILHCFIIASCSLNILAKDKATKNYVVIELKRDQSSDDTFGQLTRYMGWVKRHLKDENVKGIIIAGRYDKKLDYALEYAPNDT